MKKFMFTAFLWPHWSLLPFTSQRHRHIPDGRGGERVVNTGVIVAPGLRVMASLSLGTDDSKLATNLY